MVFHSTVSAKTKTWKTMNMMHDEDVVEKSHVYHWKQSKDLAMMQS